MASFVSSILHNSANKLESMSKSHKKQHKKHPPLSSSRLAMHASTPILNHQQNLYYHHPNMSYSAEYIPSPPPYDQQQQQQQQQQQMYHHHHHTPIPTPSTSWTSEMSVFADKIKDDVCSNSKSGNVDRHSISQGMKLVSIAADEYEDGNESVALDIYLTGVDKILMALPNKTDIHTKNAIRDKLTSVEERVGILHLASSQKQKMRENSNNTNQENSSALVNSFILSRITSTISNITTKAYQNTIIEQPIEKTKISTMPTLYIEGNGDPMTKFKKLGQYVIDVTVTCAILVKQSPLPDLISFFFGYLIQLFFWFDSQYHIMQRLQDMSIEFIKLGIQADEKYHLHEFLTEGIYMIIVAGLKAAVAFKETPRHNHKIIIQEQEPRPATWTWKPW